MLRGLAAVVLGARSLVTVAMYLAAWLLLAIGLGLLRVVIDFVLGGFILGCVCGGAVLGALVFVIVLLDAYRICCGARTVWA